VKNAAEAIEFYKKAFGAREGMRLTEPSGRIGHAEIRIGDSEIMLEDEYPEFGVVSAATLGGSPVRMRLRVENVDAFVERAVAAGAKMAMPVKDEFYGERTGKLMDPYGLTWIVSTPTEILSAAEMQRRFEALMKREEERPAPGWMREGFRTVTPYLAAREAEGLIEFVKKAFGAEGQTYGIGSAGGVHAEYRIGDTMLMLGGGVAGQEFRGKAMPTALHLYVKDADAVYQQAIEAGAKAIREPADMPYGDREGSVKDPAGNYWYIATHKATGHAPEGFPSVTTYLHPLRAEPVINFLKRAFGAEELGRHASPDGVIHHATVKIGNSFLELGEAHGEFQPMPTMFYLYVEDADTWYQRAMAAGATSIQEPTDQPYGDRVGAVGDAFGNQWYMATPAKRATG
jgi:PhnB protein